MRCKAEHLFSKWKISEATRQNDEQASGNALVNARDVHISFPVCERTNTSFRMPKTNFQYDESGTTFYYVLLTFLGGILIPSTYYFWPQVTMV